jgi:colanic acid biosynthesis glycosyl transferase WcaI
MRVGLLTQYYPPEMGAPQARLSFIAQRLTERGHEVIVLTAMPNYPQGRVFTGYGGVFRHDEVDGVRVVRTYVYAATGIGVARMFNYLSFTVSSAIIGTFKLPRLDYLLTECPPLFLGFSGYVLSRFKGARWIFNVSDLWVDSAVRLGALREGRTLRIAKALERFCYRKAWRVTGQSREIIRGIQANRAETRTYHLSNGVVTESFSPALRSPEVRRELAEDSSVIAIYAGLHGYAQGLGQVLQAAARTKELEKLRIVLIGEGPEKPALLEQAKAAGLTNVSFRDPVAREAVPALLASADIAIVPLKETLFGAVPSKIYEAMASGLPIVLAAAGEAADIVNESQAGIVVPPGDAQALAKALRKLTMDASLRRQMGEAGVNAAKTRFDRRVITDEFIDYLEEQHTSQDGNHHAR